MNVVVEIPEELGRELADSPAALGRRIVLDLAIYYYAQQLVSLGKAAELSGLPRGEFETLLAERGIERNYSVADLNADLQWAKIGD
jgi:predicted HTH domain antitoxin